MKRWTVERVEGGEAQCDWSGREGHQGERELRWKLERPRIEVTSAGRIISRFEP
jgi:hypothetical protein